MEPVFTPQQIAERWNCSLGVIRTLIRSGKLNAFRVGRLLRVSERNVILFEQSN